MQLLEKLLKTLNIKTKLQTFYQEDSHISYQILVPGSQVVSIWHKFRQQFAQTGYWPVILGTKDEVEWVKDSIDYHTQSIAEILAEGVAIDVPNWFATHTLANQEDQEDQEDQQDQEELSDSAQLSSNSNNILNFKPKIKVDTPITNNSLNNIVQLLEDNSVIVRDILAANLQAKMVIALVPLQHSWQLPAYLKFGGWNSCPSPAEHVALLKYWDAQYSLEMVGLIGDTLEMIVTKPPTLDAQAQILAQEQYIYCPDIVDEEVDTVAELASMLIDAPIWSFWWD